VAGVARRLLALDVRRTAELLFGTIAVLAVAGIMAALLDPQNAWLGLDSELDLGWPPTEISLALPAMWSASLLSFAGVAWLAVGWHAPSAARVAAQLLALALLFLAVDELFRVHERIEARTGIEWLVMYIPLAAIVAGCMAALAWRYRGRGTRVPLLLVAAGLCWGMALLLEALQWRGDVQVQGYELFMIPEELLELSGTSLLILAALLALRVRTTG
jgi:hypothetical protein